MLTVLLNTVGYIFIGSGFGTCLLMAENRDITEMMKIKNFIIIVTLWLPVILIAATVLWILIIRRALVKSG